MNKEIVKRMFNMILSDKDVTLFMWPKEHTMEV